MKQHSLCSLLLYLGILVSASCKDSNQSKVKQGAAPVANEAQCGFEAIAAPLPYQIFLPLITKDGGGPPFKSFYEKLAEIEVPLHAEFKASADNPPVLDSLPGYWTALLRFHTAKALLFSHYNVITHYSNKVLDLNQIRPALQAIDADYTAQRETLKDSVPPWKYRSLWQAKSLVKIAEEIRAEENAIVQTRSVDGAPVPDATLHYNFAYNTIRDFLNIIPNKAKKLGYVDPTLKKDNDAIVYAVENTNHILQLIVPSDPAKPDHPHSGIKIETLIFDAAMARYDAVSEATRFEDFGSTNPTIAVAVAGYNPDLFNKPTIDRLHAQWDAFNVNAQWIALATQFQDAFRLSLEAPGGILPNIIHMINSLPGTEGDELFKRDNIRQMVVGENILLLGESKSLVKKLAEGSSLLLWIGITLVIIGFSIFIPPLGLAVGLGLSAYFGITEATDAQKHLEAEKALFLTSVAGNKLSTKGNIDKAYQQFALTVAGTVADLALSGGDIAALRDAVAAKLKDLPNAAKGVFNVGDLVTAGNKAANEIPAEDSRVKKALGRINNVYKKRWLDFSCPLPVAAGTVTGQGEDTVEEGAPDTDTMTQRISRKTFAPKTDLNGNVVVNFETCQAELSTDERDTERYLYSRDLDSAATACWTTGYTWDQISSALIPFTAPGNLTFKYYLNVADNLQKVVLVSKYLDPNEGLLFKRAEDFGEYLLDELRLRSALMTPFKSGSNYNDQAKEFIKLLSNSGDWNVDEVSRFVSNIFLYVDSVASVAKLHLRMNDLRMTTSKGRYIAKFESLLLKDDIIIGSVFETLPGVNLIDFVTDPNNKPSVDSLLDIAEQVIEIGANLRENRIIHGDFRPKNFIWDDQTRRLYLVDFSPQPPAELFDRHMADENLLYDAMLRAIFARIDESNVSRSITPDFLIKYPNVVKELERLGLKL